MLDVFCAGIRLWWTLTALALVLASSALGAASRIVVIKSDGLPGYLLDEYANRKNEETGRWELPWIRKVFLDGGAEVANFYTHGITVSAPSWCVLETGRESIIRGNVEFDRYSLHAYDYLNFFPFYFRNARSQQVDMPGVEVLDGVGLPMVSDAFQENERFQGFQLYQRGVSWAALRKSLNRSLNPHSVRNLVDEWLVGLQVGDSVNQETEAELLEKLKDPRIHYLDLFHSEFDHVAHLTHDRRILLEALRGLDSLVGRIWTAIESSGLADETALVVVSDHGINNDPAVFGQGWNLVDALRSAAGGGHHVVTNRHLRSDYKIRGLNPFVNEVTNESADSFYLKGAASSYPTALVDPDGNERACLYLRNSGWNELQILRQQLRRQDLPDAARNAAGKAIRELADRDGDRWSKIDGESAADLDRLQPLVDRMKAEAHGGAEDARREAALAERAEEQLHAYREYMRSVSALLAAPEKNPTEQLIPRRAMGALNSIHQLQNYAVGLAPGGLALAADGSLDWQRSFRRVNYFAYFTGVQVRNVPQASVGARPVDFVVARVPREELVRSLGPDLSPDDDGVWLYKDEQSQALLLRRGDRIRYLPVKGLEESREGELRLSVIPLKVGLPLSLFEDLGADWLGQWRTQREWMRAAPRCAYSNAAIGLLAEMSQPKTPADAGPWREFQWNERRSTAADLLLLASNHWNFNVRSFNAGGNHGSFFPVSSHATLLFAGGSKTGIPRGLRIAEAYDGLSFAPTVLKLAGKVGDKQLPGPVIEELFK